MYRRVRKERFKLHPFTPGFAELSGYVSSFLDSCHLRMFGERVELGLVREAKGAHLLVLSSE